MSWTAILQYNVAYLRKYLTVEWSMQLKHGSWYSPVEHIKFAGIVSNPPYIPHNQMQHLQVRAYPHEPCCVILHFQLLSVSFLSDPCKAQAAVFEWKTDWCCSYSQIWKVKYPALQVQKPAMGCITLNLDLHLLFCCCAVLGLGTNGFDEHA